MYAQYRYKHPVTGKWHSIELGRLYGEDELEATAIKMGRASFNFDEALEPFREKARAFQRKLRAGLDPRSEAGPEGLTLRQALSLHLHLQPDLSARTEKAYTASVEGQGMEGQGYLRDWLDVPLRKLSRTMVRERHEKITRDAGPYAANGTMRVLRALWNTALGEDASLPEAPTIALRRRWHDEKRREAAIPLAQLPRWFREVEALRTRVQEKAHLNGRPTDGAKAAARTQADAHSVRRADLYLLGVLTGARRSDLSAIRREHVDLNAGTLHVPKPKGGTKRAFTLPLSDAALALLARVLRSHNSEWAFPANSGSGHIVALLPTEKDGFTLTFTVHGLRATFISAAAAAGVNPYHAQLLANHRVRKGDVHGGYIRADVDALRQSQQKVTDFLRKHGLPL